MISVIIPFKNSEPWLKRCVDSLHNNNGDFEFIFINDHSEDNGVDIIMECDDERIVLVDNKRCDGVSGARNTGLDLARGRWITFLDSDDAMLPNAAHKFNKLLKTKADMHQSNHSRYYHRTGKTVTKYKNPEGFYDFSNLYQCKGWCIVWNKLISSNLVKDIRFDESMQYGEDELFVLDCLARCNQMHHGADPIALHCFGNKKSLVHTKTSEDLWRQAHALEEFIKRQDDVHARRAVCRLLSEHWGSKTYLDSIGGCIDE